MSYCAHCGTQVVDATKLCPSCGKPPAGQLVVKPSRGPWVIVVVVLLAGLLLVGGIVAAIAIPNLLTAVQRSKQKRTMADIRSIATAWESFATDMNMYTPAGQQFSVPEHEIQPGELEEMLVPKFIQALPRLDGWGNAMRFRTDQASGARSYAILSAGKDGVFQQSYDPGPQKSADADIVFSDGTFVSYPDAIGN